MYGAPTGRRVAYRILADCAIRDDHVYDEWLVRDQSAVVQQLGFDVVDWTRDLIAREGGPETCVQPMTPANDVAGPYDGRGNDNEWGARYADIVGRIMAADLAVIPADYDRAVSLFYPGGQDGFGWSDADQFWMGLRAAFPDATFTIEHVIGRDDPLMPPRAALRWTLHGRHSGWGRFGTPTGAEVYIMGMSQAEFGPFGHGGRTDDPPRMDPDRRDRDLEADPAARPGRCMKGFDPKFADLPDYILKITKEIWEDRGLAHARPLLRAATSSCASRSGIVRGNQRRDRRHARDARRDCPTASSSART